MSLDLEKRLDDLLKEREQSRESEKQHHANVIRLNKKIGQLQSVITDAKAILDTEETQPNENGKLN